MRFNEAKRNLQQVDKEELKSDDFIKSCKYIANKVYHGNRNFFTLNGVGYDDIYSLSTFYGACYLGYKSKEDAYDNKRYYLMMISSVCQRLNRFTHWTAKKMQSCDVTDRLHLESVLEQESFAPFITENKLGVIKIDGIKMWGEDEGKTLEEKLDDSLSSLEDIELQPELENYTVKSKKARKQIKSIKKEIMTTKKEKNVLFRSLKKKLNASPDEYETQLIYYACTKHVSSDIRKVARRYCDKLGINYKQKASSILPQFDTKNYEIL